MCGVFDVSPLGHGQNLIKRVTGRLCAAVCRRRSKQIQLTLPIPIQFSSFEGERRTFSDNRLDYSEKAAAVLLHKFN